MLTAAPSPENIRDKITGHASGSVGRDYGYFSVPTLAQVIRAMLAWKVED